jgi:hypothetical protein
MGKKYGYPFFTLYKEKSGINGNFPGIHNVGHLISSEQCAKKLIRLIE